MIYHGVGTRSSRRNSRTKVSSVDSADVEACADAKDGSGFQEARRVSGTAAEVSGQTVDFLNG